MPLDSQTRKRRVLEAMAASLESPVTSTEGLQPETRPVQSIPYPNVPTEEQMAETSQQTRPYRVGYGAKGLSGVDRDMLKQKVMEEAPARSEIEDRGDTIGYGTVKKGEPWWKRLGKGVLTGLAEGDPDNPNNILGSAIGGGVMGVSSNQNAAELKRAIDLRKGENDIARGLKLEQEAGQLANIRLKPQDKAQFGWVKQDTDGDGVPDTEAYSQLEAGMTQPIPRRPESERAPRAPILRTVKNPDGTETTRKSEDNGKTWAIVPELTSTPPKQPDLVGQRSAEERSRNRAAAEAELAELTANEQAAGAEKNRAYQVLEQLKKAQRGTEPNKPSLEDVDQATQAAETADRLYQSFGAKKTEARRRIIENSDGSRSQPRKTGSYTEADVRARARAAGKDPDAAVAKAKKAGLLK